MKQLPLLLAAAFLAASSPAWAETVSINASAHPFWQDAGGKDDGWSWLRNGHDWSWDRHGSGSWHDHDPGDPGGSVGGVPESSTWAMMLAGFALVGAVAWRRTKEHRLAGL